MNPDFQRRIQRYGWDKAARYYEKGWQKQLWSAQERLIREAAFQRGEQVLDISCGTGLVTFPIAEAVEPGGRVTGVDLSEGMIKEAAIAAERQGIKNATFKHMDAEGLEFEDHSFDVAINSLGLMYVPDPGKAIREMYRVLKPGGRALALVWGRRSECGWAEIFPIVDRRVKSDVCPLFFQLGTGENILHAFQQSGFNDVHISRFSQKMHFDSKETAITGAFLGGAVALAYQKFNKETQKEVHVEYLNSIEMFRNEQGFEIPGEFVIASGIRS